MNKNKEFANITSKNNMKKINGNNTKLTDE